MKNELCSRGLLPHLRAAATDLRSTTDDLPHASIFPL